jgi:3-oxoacyl-[acyl-carrier-protein] synthase II
LAGAVEELSFQTFFGFYKAGCLAGSDGRGPEISSPFDKRRNGIILGEGSCVLVLEDLESALERKAQIYAQVLGAGSCFDLRLKGVVESMRIAIKEAQIAESDIDYICSAANSTKDIDLAETEAIKEVFGSRSDKIPVSSIKSMIGESYSVSGVFQLAAAVGAITKQMIPPTINYEEKDPQCDLNYVTNRAKASSVSKALINAFGVDGYSSSMIISAYG